MTTDALLGRLLDQMTEVAEAVSALNVKTEAIVDRLDKLNGTVARHEQTLNENKIWQATHEQSCKPKLSEAAIIKIAAMVCVTILTAVGAKASGLVEAVAALVK